jgi:phosphatidylglycerophosphate synthase
VKSIANCITVSRIFLSITLALVKPLSAAFFAVYLVCAGSDVLDGYIARKTGTVSKLGDNLDSVADFIMDVVLIIVLFPIINPTVQIIVWVTIIAIIKVAAVVVALVKYHTFEMLHTYGNKTVGFMLFVFPMSLAFVRPDVPGYIICVAASISAIEELLIHLSSSELRIGRKTIFT